MDNQKEFFEQTLNKLCDENDSEPITLLSQNGKEFSFEQIAVIPQEEKLYIILKPVEHIDGLGEDEGLVFYANEEEYRYELVTEEEIIDKVFSVYDSLLEEENEDE